MYFFRPIVSKKNRKRIKCTIRIIVAVLAVISIALSIITLL